MQKISKKLLIKISIAIALPDCALGSCLPIMKRHSIEPSKTDQRHHFYLYFFTINIMPRAPNPTTCPTAVPNNSPPKIAGATLSVLSLHRRDLTHEPPADRTHPRPQTEIPQAPTAQANCEIAAPEADSAKGIKRPTVPEPIRSPGDGFREEPYLSYLGFQEGKGVYEVERGGYH